MSLTPLLEITGSELRKIFTESLPRTRGFVARRNRELTTVPLNSGKSSAPGLSGTAVDYQLRHYFGITPLRETVAWHGARRMAHRLDLQYPSGSDYSFTSASRRYFERAETEIRDLDPPGRALGEQQALTLARRCIVLSYFEQYFRAALSPLFDRAQAAGRSERQVAAGVNVRLRRETHGRSSRHLSRPTPGTRPDPPPPLLGGAWRSTPSLHPAFSRSARGGDRRLPDGPGAPGARRISAGAGSAPVPAPASALEKGGAALASLGRVTRAMRPEAVLAHRL